MNVKCTLNGVVVYIVAFEDYSGSGTDVLYVKDSDKKVYLGRMGWDSSGNLQFTEIREVANSVTHIDGVAL